MSDEFKRELREIGSRLKVRREATLNAQQDQLSRVEAAIQWWEKGIASNIKQAVQEANTALAETGAKTRPKITISIIEDDGFERNKQLEISLTQGGDIAVLPFRSNCSVVEFDKDKIQQLILAFVHELEDER